MTKVSHTLCTKNLFKGCILRKCFFKRPERCTSKLSLFQSYFTSLPLNSNTEPYSGTSIPFRKYLKDLQKGKKLRDAENLKRQGKENDKWELTVGIEIHALLNTERKLFSPALSTINQKANTHIEPFDIAIPGSQPIFQKEILIPAIRAALILNSEIQTISKFDRKHYFHWDQPAGYQITQYYEPFAKNGYITLFAHDGIAKEDGDQISIKIEKIQLEQDTAKTISKPGGYLLDFNRAGLPLIEIVTYPEIHYPKTAAAFVRKVQILLDSVNACVVGMEYGGLRADINVSVNQRDNFKASNESDSKRVLNQKTEIKNLSSFKSIEDAIIVERDRQISALEDGRIVTSETRGWTIGASETKKLRNKEGEVDYRYMPDPDLPPVVIGQNVISHLKSTMGISPDEEISILVNHYNLTVKDAMTLTSLENGGRVEFFYKVVENLQSQLPNEDPKKIGRLCSNWVLHDMASLRHDGADDHNPLQMKADGNCFIPSEQLAELLFLVETGKILRKPAKYVLRKLFTQFIEKSPTTPQEIIEEECLWNEKISEDQYEKLAEAVIGQHEGILNSILAGNQAKIKILLGMMLKNDIKGVLDPTTAEQAIKKIIKMRG